LGEYGECLMEKEYDFYLRNFSYLNSNILNIGGDREWKKELKI